MACYNRQPEATEAQFGERITLRMCGTCLQTLFVPKSIADLENYECDECQDIAAKK
ncbi:hypothetical protein VT84_33030 [Gemmata sp. SH-PL17]|uniref:hypothetical protein n=1 Tax=Gemmata sp. SH-PL17 TaxID=1630693 RepID=UPI00078E9151|nr:hypothetical protein [Gemmata sp. SH-PL17]AMV29266.1 hypothetical protein VT84_33030 [Gemmata sp. SH-PL17]